VTPPAQQGRESLLDRIERETTAVLDRCDAKLRQLTARYGPPVASTDDIMARWRAALARIAAERVAQRQQHRHE
jgi:hypothetical protein